MSFELRLPNIGEGVKEADIAEILVSVGDMIEADQAVMELETDKAVIELPSPRGGKVEKILVSSGDTVQIDSPLMIIATSSGVADSTRPSPPAPAQPQSSRQEASPATRQETPPAPAKEESRSSETEIVEGTIDFQVPPLGEGVSSADVADILVAVGDVITAEQAVMELETDKAVVELPCPYPGKIKKIHVASGTTVKVGDVVLTIETTSKVGGTSGKPASPAADTLSAPLPEKKAAPVAETPAVRSSQEAPPLPATRTTDKGIPVPAAPSTRRLARQLGVDLHLVKGSGRGGRIVEEDVQNFVRERLQNASVPARIESTGAPMAGSLAPPPLPDFSRFGLIEREKMNKIARTAAENLTVSWNVIPHVTQHDRVDITDLEAARKRFVSGVGKNGPKVTMTAIVMKALAKCLQAYPKFNSSLDPETNEIVYKKYYHLGCAVDTPNGLLVPVIRDCDKKSILEIAVALSDLAEKARDRKLPVTDMQGATCTVTNLGGIGGVAFTPIVNYPEVCILGMCRGQQELRLVDGKVEERLILPLSLSYDHRVINGADAARFVVALANLLSDPFQLLTMV